MTPYSFLTPASQVQRGRDTLEGVSRVHERVDGEGGGHEHEQQHHAAKHGLRADELGSQVAALHRERLAGRARRVRGRDGVAVGLEWFEEGIKKASG